MISRDSAASVTATGTAATTVGDSATKPGILSVSTYSQGSTNALSVAIGGTTVGTKYSQLASSNGISLSGTLNIKRINSFIPAVGSTFTIVTGSAITWKTTSARYPTQPDGLLALDPQLVCYSWITGISEVAQVVFVRKRLVEIQYLHTTITDEQRREFSQLVEATIRQIESAQFLPHSGIRFPQNPCSSCPYIGLCLGRQDLVQAALIRRPGAEQLDWIDERHY